MKIKEVINVLESYAPAAFQEGYDNSGVQVGDVNAALKGVLLTLDCTEEVVDEALNRGCNLIVAHHPVIFGGIKRLTGSSYVERTVEKAIRNDVVIYAAHTNLDNVSNGVSDHMAKKLGLEKCRVLEPKAGLLKKLVVFVPGKHADKVRAAIFKSGGGKIGNYDCCSYNLEGKGTFRPGDDTDPYVGDRGEIHEEAEVRVEVIVPGYQAPQVIRQMIDAHPYEEVAYDLYPLDNMHPEVGSGIIGSLQKPMNTMDFLKTVKKTFNAGSLRYTKPVAESVQKVALCGGSGSFLLSAAKRVKADVFITGDFKYHQFFDAEDQIVIADIGHYESEQYTTELIAGVIKEKFPTFAIHFTETNTNPIKYL